MERGKAELDEEVDRNRMCTESDMPKLHYIRAIVTETLRLHPAAPLMMPQETTADCRIAGHGVPADARVLINRYASGRSPENWEDPLHFNPDRFLDRALSVPGREEELVRALGHDRDDSRMLSFGAERRICPGTNLGLAVEHRALANLIHGFEWSASEEALDLAEKSVLSKPHAGALARHSPGSLT